MPGADFGKIGDVQTAILELLYISSAKGLQYRATTD